MVLYAEVPGFYAEVERSAEPALRERPVVVGGDPRKRGSVFLDQRITSGLPVAHQGSDCDVVALVLDGIETRDAANIDD